MKKYASTAKKGEKNTKQWDNRETTHDEKRGEVSSSRNLESNVEPRD